jgi:hypothetical protein
MLSRHTNEVYLRLEQVEDAGFAVFTGSELRRWYGQERLSKTVWRDVMDKWEEITGHRALRVGKSFDNHVLISGKWSLEDGDDLT